MDNLKADLKRKQQIFAEDGAQVSMLRIWMADGTSANVPVSYTHLTLPTIYSV